MEEKKGKQLGGEERSGSGKTRRQIFQMERLRVKKGKYSLGLRKIKGSRGDEDEENEAKIS